MRKCCVTLACWSVVCCESLCPSPLKPSQSEASQNGWRAARPQPPPLFQKQKCLLRQANSPLSEAAKICTRASSTQEEDLGSFKSHSSYIEPSGLQDMWSGCKVCKWAELPPPTSLRFFQRQTSRHKKPILNLHRLPHKNETATRNRSFHQMGFGD